jgi:hypothetical protein
MVLTGAMPPNTLEEGMEADRSNEAGAADQNGHLIFGSVIISLIRIIRVHFPWLGGN